VVGEIHATPRDCYTSDSGARAPVAAGSVKRKKKKARREGSWERGGRPLRRIRFGGPEGELHIAFDAAFEIGAGSQPLGLEAGLARHRVPANPPIWPRPRAPNEPYRSPTPLRSADPAHRAVARRCARRMNGAGWWREAPRRLRLRPRIEATSSSMRGGFAVPPWPRLFWQRCLGAVASREGSRADRVVRPFSGLMGYSGSDGVGHQSPRPKFPGSRSSRGSPDGRAANRIRECVVTQVGC